MTSMELRSIQDYEPLPSEELQYPLAFMEENLTILLVHDANRRVIGITDADNNELIDQLRLYHTQDLPPAEDIEFVKIDRSDLLGYLARKMGDRIKERDSRLGRSDQVTLDKLANDAPIINLVNTRILEGFRARASDIHIESLQQEVQIRYRIDGVLRTVERLDRNLFPAISSRLKLMANLNIMERRLPQDGRFTVEFEKEAVDIRISIVPTARGESIVLRLFQKSSTPMGLDELGFDKKQLGQLRKLYQSPHGLILATGPTGSGKTTTLNGILREINSEEIKIITIEDPVEYAIDGIDQIQTQEDIGLSFNTLLRRILRQDPDIIMVGEIRDSETADLAVRAALTGHLVLSTLHTNSAVATVQRLINMGIPSYLLAAVLRATMAQRLVRRICPHCKESYEADEHEIALFQPIKKHPKKLYRGKGCKECGGSGYLGRVALVEILENDAKVEQEILNDSNTVDIENIARKAGMKLLFEDGLEKALAGETSLSEIQRVIFAN